MSKDNMYKFMEIMLIMGMALCFQQGMASAIDDEGLEKLQAELAELQASDPDLAKAVREELEDAVKTGEVDLGDISKDDAEDLGVPELARPEAGKDIVGGYGDKDYRPKVDPKEMAKIAERLAKEGKSPAEIKEIMAKGYEDIGRPGGFDRPMPNLETEKGRAEALKTFDLEKGRMLDEGFTKDEVAKIEKALKEGKDPSELFRDKFEKEGAVLGERGGGYDFYREAGGTDTARDWAKDGGYGGLGEGRPELAGPGRDFEKMDKGQMEKSFKEFMDRAPTKEEMGNMERGPGREPMREMDTKEAKEFAERGMKEAEEKGREVEGRAREEVGREMAREAERGQEKETAERAVRETEAREITMPEREVQERMLERQVERPEIYREYQQPGQ